MGGYNGVSRGVLCRRTKSKELPSRGTKRTLKESVVPKGLEWEQGDTQNPNNPKPKILNPKP